MFHNYSLQDGTTTSAGNTSGFVTHSGFFFSFYQTLQFSHSKEACDIPVRGPIVWTKSLSFILYLLQWFCRKTDECWSWQSASASQQQTIFPPLSRVVYSSYLTEMLLLLLQELYCRWWCGDEGRKQRKQRTSGDASERTCNEPRPRATCFHSAPRRSLSLSLSLLAPEVSWIFTRRANGSVCDPRPSQSRRDADDGRGRVELISWQQSKQLCCKAWHRSSLLLRRTWPSIPDLIGAPRFLRCWNARSSAVCRIVVSDVFFILCCYFLGCVCIFHSVLSLYFFMRIINWWW